MTTYEQWAQQAMRLETDHRWAEAAGLWERLGDVDRAINACKRAGHGERAARMLEARGRFKEAAAMFKSVGMYVQAAGLYDRLRAYEEAARCYLRVGEREQAALTFERAGLLEDAAKVYASLRNVPKAVQLFEAAGNGAEAQRLSREHGLDGAAPAAPASPEQQSFEALLRGEGAFADERHVVDAVLYFLEKDRVADAANLYSHCREDIGYPVITAVTGRRELEVRLAKMFYGAKDFHKTAQVLENLDEHGRAAALYERADDFEAAAEVYARIGNAEKAAEMYERSGRFSEAADLFLRAGIEDRAAVNFERCQDYFLAGKLFYGLQKGNKSLQLLQRVQRTEPGYLEAALMVGAILSAGGHAALAAKKYLDAMQGRQLDESTAPIQYRLALLYDDHGRKPEAKQLYEALLAWRFDFEDVQARLADLEAAAEPPEIDLIEEAGVEEATVVTMMDGFDFLKETKLFGELSLDEIKAVYHAAETRTFAPGAVLIEQDQPGRALYVLRSGAVSVRKVRAGSDVELARLGSGAPIGEMSLFDDNPTSARVVATEPVEAFEISKSSLEKLLAGSDRLALRIFQALVQTLTGRLRETSARQG
jgi:tetratricopeptide (TPR) repeat protein